MGIGKIRVRETHERKLWGSTKEEKLTIKLGPPRGIHERVEGYGLGWKLFHLGHLIGLRRSSHWRKLITHFIQVNWRLDLRANQSCWVQGSHNWCSQWELPTQLKIQSQLIVGWDGGATCKRGISRPWRQSFKGLVSRLEETRERTKKERDRMQDGHETRFNSNERSL